MTREEAISLLKGLSRTMIPSDDDNPVIEALGMAIKALEQEPSEIIHGCTYGGVSWGGTYKPQEPKTGHWIDLQLIPDDITGHMCGECSMCHKVRIVDNYCPNCGAKMEVSDGTEI